MNMSDGITTYNYVIEFDFANYDDEQHCDDVGALENELFEDVSFVLSRLLKKYNTLVGVRQKFENTTLSRGEYK